MVDLPDGGRVGWLLRGEWLGHPLHPVLTDLPIGFWTSAWVLDLTGDERSEPVADAFVALGVLAAVPTAASGLADWLVLPRDKQPIGRVHAATMAVTTALYTASWFHRRRGDRPTGVRLAHVAAATATFGGFLGGHLAFGRTGEPTDPRTRVAERARPGR